MMFNVTDTTSRTQPGLNTWPLGHFDWGNSVEPERTLRTLTENGTKPVIQVASYYNGGASNRYVRKFLDSSPNKQSEVSVVVQCGLREREDGCVTEVSQPEELESQVNRTMDQLNVDKVSAVQLVVPGDDDQSLAVPDPLVKRKRDGRSEAIGIQYLTPDGAAHSIPKEVDFITIPYNLFDVASTDVVPPNHSKPILCSDPLAGGLLTQYYAERKPDEIDADVRNHHPDFFRTRQQFIRCTRALSHYALEHDIRAERVETLALAWLRKRLKPRVIFLEAHKPDQSEYIRRSLNVECSEQQLEEMESIVTDTIDGSNMPGFLSPPPVRPTHSYERHVAGSFLRPENFNDASGCSP